MKKTRISTETGRHLKGKQSVIGKKTLPVCTWDISISLRLTKTVVVKTVADPVVQLHHHIDLVKPGILGCFCTRHQQGLWETVYCIGHLWTQTARGGLYAGEETGGLI